MMKRIERIAEMTGKGMITADIGTDHAFLPILLLEKGMTEKAYACDVNEGPLKAACENIEAHGLTEKIETILCNGFEGVPEDTECAVIAGMGCHTAIGILERSPDFVANLKRIVVQVNNEVPVLREWISAKGWTIEEEAAVYEKGHDYIAIAFSPVQHAPYSAVEILVGPKFMENPDEDFKAYCSRKTEKLEKILQCRPDCDPARNGLEDELSIWKKWC